MKRITKTIIFQERQDISELRESLVYFLLRGEAIVYVGQSKVGVSRILAHQADKDFDGFFVLRCPEAELNEAESSYIKKFAPLYNVKGLGEKPPEKERPLELQDFYTIKEAASQLRVTPRTVLRWCHAKKIGYFKPSAKVFLIPRDDILRLLSGETIQD